ncbi:XrtA-associated tyrosine autokinase [Peristeroidobacter agariperforans]|uniref:XrtA-associated tyrosine autokinase n=1 Tax=Peristeroidobacter agariperforans TaxID=268404 RepID=UPI0013008E7F|nr:XrtA-associated tyrosine autokinase [Peristeroidobacter agariperforans]
MEPPQSLARLLPAVEGTTASSTGSSKIVQIDRASLRANGLLAPENHQRRLADEYRQIKRPIIAHAIGRGPDKVARGHLVMVASAMAGEGKTFSSINLAMSLSLEKDISVLLVDADIPKPHITRTFALENEPGLLDVLRDENMRVEDLVVRTDVDGLSILPVGKQSETAEELLASARMEQIALQLGTQDPNRIVLFDSPPLLLTSESRVLAGLVGQIILVVRAGSTTQQMVQEAISYLGEGRSIGLVLNQCEMETKTGYYYGYAPSGSGTAN